jgi:plastocyanin
MHRKTWTLVAALAALALLGRAAAVPPQPIAIVDFAFTPATAPEPYNAPITWTNTGAFAHTVTFDTLAIDSGTLAPGQSFAVTLPITGSFAYHCAIHPTMRGTITVQLATPPPTFTHQGWLPALNQSRP